MAISMDIASGSWMKTDFLKGKRRNCKRVCCSSASLRDQYRTLRIQPGASEKEVKKAFRKLALQSVMSSLRESSSDDTYSYNVCNDDGYGEESMRGMHDSNWDLWEEWMGWEGAGIRDYSSHINPYI
ncbi:chaperone protein dnaJ 8, chloroplastic-like isoform X2 [Magnolia sinica]|uniref:chaperone protein dnaJ 8, chloroplastic-like isoform X2 n=1 Tax=Magnolia sinica TaxID=86752 RepID=UPI0026581A0E|nr:chaperone protein dnaJ 8, chloroplastic-like isoform X2 [Magnolia sinica]